MADGYIWGRGTLDIKNQVFGILEAAEYLLAHGKSFTRTAYLHFGDDEETFEPGAKGHLRLSQGPGGDSGIFSDEGGGKIESGAAFGAPDIAIAHVDLMEKGYADLELSARPSAAIPAVPTAARPWSIWPAPSPTSPASPSRCGSAR